MTNNICVCIHANSNLKDEYAHLFINQPEDKLKVVPFAPNQDTTNNHHVIMGGDGSINYFINNIFFKNKINKVLYFPLGTANDFARSLNLAPVQPTRELIQEILDYNRTLSVPIAKCNNLYFINSLVIGSPANVTESGESLLKKATGKISYYLNALKEVFINQVHSFTIEYGQKKVALKNQGVLVSQGLYAGGGTKISQSLCPNFNEYLTLVTPNNSDLAESIPEFIKLQTSINGSSHLNLMMLKEKKLAIKFSKSTCAKLDGEKFESSEFEV